MSKYSTQSKFHRINVTLPQETVRLLEKVTEKGNRSRLVNEAVRFYVKEVGKANLRKQLREGAIVRAGRDLCVAQDWFHIENEVWQGNQK